MFNNNRLVAQLSIPFYQPLADLNLGLTLGWQVRLQDTIIAERIAPLVFINTGYPICDSLPAIK